MKQTSSMVARVALNIMIDRLYKTVQFQAY